MTAARSLLLAAPAVSATAVQLQQADVFRRQQPRSTASSQQHHCITAALSLLFAALATSATAVQLLPADVNQRQQPRSRCIWLSVGCQAHLPHHLFCFNWIAATIVTAPARNQYRTSRGVLKPVVYPWVASALRCTCRTWPFLQAHASFACSNQSHSWTPAGGQVPPFNKS
jgi:hypothetical protein